MGSMTVRCMKERAVSSPGIEIESREHGFKAVGEQHGLAAAAVAFLPAAKAQMIAQMQRLRDIAKMPAADQRGTQPSEVAFLKIGKRFVERLRDEQAEYGIAQKLELLVVGRSPLGRPGACSKASELCVTACSSNARSRKRCFRVRSSVSSVRWPMGSSGLPWLQA